MYNVPFPPYKEGYPHMQESSGNGRAHMTPHDDALINQINDAKGVLMVERERLMEEVADLDHSIKRYDKALKALTESWEPKAQPQKKVRNRTRETALAGLARSESWPVLREQIIAFAREHEQVTQAEFRKYYDDDITSGKASLAFELLRREDVLRVSGFDGNLKFFRLTKEALNAE
jgi:hypothetical protein